MINLILSAVFSSFLWADELVVWNVGQGQWVTEIQPDQCTHYDMGGEKSPLKRVLQKCQAKQNYLMISHLDWDHISFIRSFYYSVKNFCILNNPVMKGYRWNSTNLISQINSCPSREASSGSIVYQGKDSKISNQTSSVFYSSNFHALFPGDSPKNIESRWSSNLPPTKILVLGHHGSRTSTSKKTLGRMHSLQVAVASARNKKYGHPHREVVELLKLKKIPLLKTEDWGNLHFLK